MRHSRLPKGSTRSAKYIVNQAGSSEAAGTTVFVFAIGTDNDLLGQSSITDNAVPVGCKIVKFDVFMPKVNLGAATANFIHWSIQRTQTGQAIINPINAGGNPLRKNIMLSGVLGLGAGQNYSGKISFKVPKKLQRIADGDVWQLVNNNGLAVSTIYQVIYKVFM